MTSDFDALDRLVAYHDHIVAPPVAVADDVRRGRRRIRRNRTLASGGVALGVAGVVATATLLTGGDPEQPQPVGPSPTRSTPSATRSEASATRPEPGWPGALRPKAALPVVPLDGERFLDGRDAAVGAIDIREVRVESIGGDMNEDDWSLEFREPFPDLPDLDEAGRIIEYGLVVDADGDRVPDCQIGINNNDTQEPGSFRVWVKNLRTGVADDRVGAPYGIPFDFVHPAEGSRSMKFFFLFATPVPCDPFDTSANFYAWAAVTDGGQVTAWDFAPDAAWLEMP